MQNPERSQHQRHLGPPTGGGRARFAAEAGPGMRPLPLQQLRILRTQALHFCPQGCILPSCSLVDHCLQQACRISLHSPQLK